MDEYKYIHIYSPSFYFEWCKITSLYYQYMYIYFLIPFHSVWQAIKLNPLMNDYVQLWWLQLQFDDRNMY